MAGRTGGGAVLAPEPVLQSFDSRCLGAIKRSDIRSGALDCGKVVGRDPALGLERTSRQRIDIG